MGGGIIIYVMIFFCGVSLVLMLLLVPLEAHPQALPHSYFMCRGRGRRRPPKGLTFLASEMELERGYKIQVRQGLRMGFPRK